MNFHIILLTGIYVISTVHADTLCQITATANCAGQNWDLLTAVVGGEGTEICRAYWDYRNCLYDQSTGCSSQDWISGLLDASCNRKCHECGGAGIKTGKLSFLIVSVILTYLFAF